ncbi:radical SAM protein [Candidatus Sumerlaeota bacterium]|nr:radical SAM protein [Candidatus Sumerlaeota bacterium]
MIQKEASYYISLRQDYVECKLCPHNCYLMPSRLGLCGVRSNRDGKLYLINYGKISHIEKKSLMELPLSPEFKGKDALFIGSIGCNLKCPFCLHWQASQVGVPTRGMMPDAVVEKALAEECGWIAFTYNEPTIGLEFVLDVARLCKEKKLSVAVHTNGFLNPTPFAELVKNIDILLVDIKSWNSEFYQVECGGSKEIILKNIASAYKNIHLEISYLVIEGVNDQEEGMSELGEWIAGLSPEVPLHLIKFQPSFRYANHKETSPVCLYQLQRVVHHYLKNVFVAGV